ncbi:hypothetical protein Hypma_014121 [Hypsizygus marmoreus]|uniref:F-box domain-containing protein n=1 Tax=Hypsizygus marmoreus TaxID=39966 RepID=A0A369K547_HYPMA|nr:hypothetical protein Hypma_014121 [Hypsizygus marmoreus]
MSGYMPTDFGHEHLPNDGPPDPQGAAILEDPPPEPPPQHQHELSHAKLPTEILCGIFALCIAGPTEVPANQEKSPWNLSQVCSRWRQIALSQHDLWSDLRFEMGGHEWDHCSSPGALYALLMQVVLSRSANRMLSLKFMIGHREPTKTDIYPLAGCLRVHANRVSDMSVLEHEHEREEHPQALAFLKGTSFPNLRSMTVTVPIDDVTYYVSWSHLEHLKISHIRTDVDIWTLYDLLERCKSLRTLASEIFYPLRWPNVIFCVCMLKLTDLVLHLTNMNGQMLTIFFDALRLPQLMKLDLLQGEEGISWGLPLTIAITRSDHLERLLIDIHIPASDCDMLLRSLPCLVEFILPWGAVMLDATRQGMAHGDIAPRMTKLMCGATRSLELHLDMLEARMFRTNATTIKDAVFVFDVSGDGFTFEKIQPEHQKRVMELKERGVNISLVNWNEAYAVTRATFPFTRSFDWRKMVEMFQSWG